MARVKPAVKYAGIAVVAIGAVFGVSALMKTGIIPAPASMKSIVAPKAEIATKGAEALKAPPAQSYDLTANPESGAPTRKYLTIPWQGAGALILANNGTGANCAGSLMEKYAGACLDAARQDSYDEITKQMLKFASGFAAGQANPDGVAYATIMGDGAPAFFAGLKPGMDKLGLHAQIIGVAGFSHGEDKCMIPDVGGDPKKALGDLIAASPRDGDWNICIKWASDNNLKVNSDVTAYDPDAINFMDVGDFATADEKYNTNACETRDLVQNGLKSGKKVNVCVNGVATWTPGDVVVIEKRPTVDTTVIDKKPTDAKPLITIASTLDYDQQMPAVIIGIKEEMDKHPQFVVGMLKAIDRAAFQIRTTQDGVKQMATAEAKVFGASGGEEATPDYWARYYVGYDSPNGKVKLGGSRASTLAEVRDFLGLGSGTLDVFHSVYDVFGKYDVLYYPTIVPSVPKYSDIIDTSYVTKALEGVQMGAPTTVAFAQARTISNVVSSKNVSIEFDTGKATLRPAARAQLIDIANDTAITNLLIKLEGHTDNTGDPDANVNLSRARAEAVKQALMKMAPATFPANRFSDVVGYGGDKPVADNSTAEGRQKNRRVVVVLGSAAN